MIKITKKDKNGTQVIYNSTEEHNRQVQKKIERTIVNKYGHSNYKSVYYTDGSYEIINLSSESK